jgi:hypothetical protein
MASSKICRRSFLFLAGAFLARSSSLLLPAVAQTVKVNKGEINGISFYRAIIDLTDPKTFITIGLANNAPVANSSRRSSGDEEFSRMVARHHAAVVTSGTFFAKSAKKTVMGNMVAGGKFLKYSKWENFGTTLGLRAGNKPEMITARVDGKPKWKEHWFSITCGPRLLRQGKIWRLIVVEESDRFQINQTQLVLVNPKQLATLDSIAAKIHMKVSLADSKNDF